MRLLILLATTALLANPTADRHKPKVKPQDRQATARKARTSDPAPRSQTPQNRAHIQRRAKK